MAILGIRWNLRALGRVAWAVVSIFVVESLVFASAVLPGAMFWEWHYQWPITSLWVRVVLLSMAFIPAYLIFAFTLILLTAIASRLTGWRTPRRAEMRISEVGWPLLNWVRYVVLNHFVIIFAGTLFRSTPIWTFYMGLNGARLGRGVFVNSLAVTDHNQLEFDDNVVIGGGVHLSGHTVENGIVKTAPVKLGKGVTVGVGAVIEIGVEAGAGCQIGALGLVPKFSKLEAGKVYVGIPVRHLEYAIPRAERQTSES